MQSSFVLEETENHSVELYGTTLPVTVTEILTLTEKTSDVSVNVSPNGWAWLVHGRRLVVWRYSKTASNASTFKWMGANCRELTLPQSDLAHSAKLVNVFSANEAQTPSCIAVSPEGIVRYWPSIAHEGSSYEVSADLQGQECFSLTDLQPIGSILSTTTATVVLVHLENVAGQHTIICRLLKSPQGILGGIGRRMSSLLWGGIASATSSEAKLVQVLGSPTRPVAGGGAIDDPFEKSVYVLTSNSFQKWHLSQGDPERLIYSCDLEAIAKQAFASSTWGHESMDPAWVRVFLLDMQPTDNGVMILMAATNTNISQELHYGLATLKTVSDIQPSQFHQFCTLKHTSPFSESADLNQLPGLSYKFLLPSSSSHQVAYVFNEAAILCFTVSPDSDEPEKLEFGAGSNIILGTGISADGRPLFFTVTHGMVTIAPTNLQACEKSNYTFNDSIVASKATRLSESLNLSISQAGLDNLTMSESKKDQLKAAFLLFCKREFNHATSIVEELFPGDDEKSSESPLLDRMVVSMSTDLIDDFPASDPRWLETLPASEATAATSGVGSSMSLLILHQLEDKQTALEVYISFLKEVGLWKKLSCVQCRELLMATSILMSEHFEKTAAAITLHKLQSEYPDLVGQAISEALKTRPNSETSSLTHLTPQDHFYRQISRIGDFVEGFQRVEQEAFLSNKLPTEIVNTVLAVNKIILTVFKECLQVRAKNQPEFQPQGDLAARWEYQPWTSAPGPRGLRTLLIRQFNVTLEKTVTIAEDGSVRASLYHQLVELCDLILDGYRTQLETIRNEDRKLAVVFKQYEKDRSALILPLVSHGCLEDAASLSEKYLEFNALVKICEATNDSGRLERYMDQFADQDFSDFVFDWHVREGKQSKLLAQSYSSLRQEKLGRFLEGHSNISWLHDLQTGRYGSASETLQTLASSEVKNVAKKKTFFSLAKLSALASGAEMNEMDSKLSRIDEAMTVVVAQEQLPKPVLDAFGFDPRNMRVMSAVELIELYTCEENASADHVDFKKALDLLDYLPQSGGSPQDLEEERSNLRQKIWARSVLRNNWNGMETKDPIATISETVFFKLVEFCHTQGLDLRTQLPSPDSLFEAEELSQIKGNPNAQFLIRTGYEHVQRQVTC